LSTSGGQSSKPLGAVKISKTTLYAIGGVVGGIILVLTSLFTIKRIRRAKAARQQEEDDDVSDDDSQASA
jgi:hypothetical protein